MTKTVAHEAILNADPEIAGAFFSGKKFLAQRFVRMIIEAYPAGTFLTPMTDQGGDVVWMYNQDKGIFESYGIPWLKEQLYNILGEKCAHRHQAEVVNLLKTATYIHPEEFIETPEIVVLKNGCYNLYTGKLEPFNPQYKARSALPITYNQDADCPTIKAFIKDILPSSLDFLQEWVGYHLLKSYPYQRCVVLLGEGDNGKSTFLNLLSNFLGHENVSSENLYRISTNRFSPAELYGKLGNVSADIGPDELRHTGIIKMLTGGDWVTAEQKNRDPFKFKNHAKLSFSCNQLPKTPDVTLAFYKRFIVLVFEKIIPPENQDADLINKLTTEEELSGLFNWAIEGLTRALKRGGLDEPIDVVARRELYTMMSDPVIGFVNECILQTYGEEYIEKDDIRRVFVAWCKQKGAIPPSDISFYKALKDNMYFKETQLRIGNRRPRVLKGVTFTEGVVSVTGVTDVTGQIDSIDKNRGNLPLDNYSGVSKTRDSGDVRDTSILKDAQKLISMVKQIEEETEDAAKEDDLVENIMWFRDYFKQVMGVAMKDGSVYSPRPGFYRVSV